MSEENQQSYEEELANSKNAAERMRAHWRNLSEDEKRTARMVGVGAAIALPLVTGVSIASAEHTDKVYDNMKDQPYPQQVHDPENFPLPHDEETPESLPLDASPVDPADIPSPQQSTQNIELPTLPSENPNKDNGN